MLRLTAAALGASALLVAGTGKAQRAFAAHLNGAGSKLTELESSYLTGHEPSVFVAWSGGWGAAAGGRAQYEVPAGRPEDPLQPVLNSAPVPLPRPQATVAFGSGTSVTAEVQLFALVPGLDTVAVWHEDRSYHWHKIQTVSVPSAPG